MENRPFSSWILERTAIGDTLRLRIGNSKIGRHSSSAIRIVNGYVSRNHAEIEVSPDNKSVILRDLESINGVYVNNVCYKQTSVEINSGDRVGIGVYKSEEENDPNLDLPIYVLKLAPLRISSVVNAETIPAKQPTLLNKSPINKDVENANNCKEEFSYRRSDTYSDKITTKCKQVEPATSHPPKEPSNQYNAVQSNLKPTQSKAQPRVESSIDATTKNCGSNNTDQFDIASKNACVPVPLLPVAKQERVSFISAKVEAIFGEPDDILLEQVKDNDPLVFLHLKNKMGNADNNSNQALGNAHLIPVSDDEDDDSDRLAVLLPPLTTEEETSGIKSPAVFDTSFNSSLGNDLNKSNHVVEKENEIQQLENENDDYANDDLLFSQAILNEIKEEFISEEEGNALSNEHVEQFANNEADDLIKSFRNNNEQTGVATINNAQANNNQIWLISDDEEDYDQELETKVSGWTNKLLSQTLFNKSQVYDIVYNSDDSVDSSNNVLNDDNDNLYGTNRNKNGVSTGIFDELFSTINTKLEKNVTEDKQNVPSDSRTSRKEIPEEIVLIDLTQTKDSKDQMPEPSTSIDQISKNDNSEVSVKCKEDLLNVSKSVSDRLSSSKSKDTHLSKPCNENVLNEKIKSARQNNKQLCIIDAPHLPTHKGKHTGVAAEKAKELNNKYTSTRAKLKSEQQLKDLKKKWIEKPSAERKRKKENDKIIKADRMKKLKELASRSTRVEETKKRKHCDENDETGSTGKKPKVKVTVQNRGALLAEEIEKKEKSECRHVPKNGENKNDKKRSHTVSSKNSSNTVTAAQKATDTKKLPGTVPNEEPNNNTDCNKTTSTSKNLTFSEALLGINETGAVVPTKKLSFASMQKNFKENRAYVELKIGPTEKLKANNEKSSIASSGGKKSNKPKVVRFNDTPIIHYIERNPHANRKVNWKDVLPMTTYKDRCRLVRQKYAIVDFSHKIINSILCWSNEWLTTKNAELLASTQIIIPLSNTFRSYDQYKNTYLTFTKLEYQIMLENDYNKVKSQRGLKATLLNVCFNKERIMLITRLNHVNATNISKYKFDIVLVTFSKTNITRFGFASTTRKGSDSLTLVVEILNESFPCDFFSNISEVNILGVIDNIRVEFGVHNAVYQLKESPLFQQILKPLELLNTKVQTRRDLKYKGYDPLNDIQKEVLMKAYSRVLEENVPNITLIQGPPGTGKSCVIANLALQCLYGSEVRTLDKKVLICAQSNCAVDVIAAKLYHISKKMRSNNRFRVIRFGVPEKIAENVQDITLQNIVQREQIKRFCGHNKAALENKTNIQERIHLLQTQVMEIKRTNYRGSSAEDELIEKERQIEMLKNALNQALIPEDQHRIFSWYLNNANIVCTTLSSCVKLSNYVKYFDICIIDEATQCTEPWTLLPLKFGMNSLVLVGDTQQLPATVLSRRAYEYGLGTSMFTRIQNCFDSKTRPNIVHTLRVQYRMHPEICKWPNLYFYNNDLISAFKANRFNTPFLPFAILSLDYQQNYHLSGGKISNLMEAEFVGKLLSSLNEYLPITRNTYGVITPYAQHRSALESVIKKIAGLDKVMVNTIDSYQGVEKDVIIISNARTNGIGFLSNYQRLNVALTRPKKCLLLCGNFKNLESVPVWQSLLNNARERNLYFQLTENSAKDIHRHVITKLLVLPNT